MANSMSESGSGDPSNGSFAFDKDSLEFECPTCGDSFDTEAGVKQHHYALHGESIAGVDIECHNCGKVKNKKPSQVNEDGPDFCGMDCRDEWYSEYSKNKVNYGCDWCGEIFEIHPFRLDQADRHFCPDSDCYGKWQSEYAVAENGRHWKGGYEWGYGPNWEEQREKARERDNFTCQDCGKHEDEHYRELVVHHIMPKRKFVDGNGVYDYKRGNRLLNLVTLCDPCHGKWEGIYLRPDPR